MLMSDTVTVRKGIGDHPIHSVNPYVERISPSSYNVAISDFKTLAKVSGNGISVLDYIFNYCGLSVSNYIEIDQLEAEKYLFGVRTRASNAYVYRGILSLLEAGVISRAVTRNYYWFNESVICLIK
jgi:hypothetical protein